MAGRVPARSRETSRRAPPRGICKGRGAGAAARAWAGGGGAGTEGDGGRVCDAPGSRCPGEGRGTRDRGAAPPGTRRKGRLPRGPPRARGTLSGGGPGGVRDRAGCRRVPGCRRVRASGRVGPGGSAHRMARPRGHGGGKRTAAGIPRRVCAWSRRGRYLCGASGAAQSRHWLGSRPPCRAPMGAGVTAAQLLRGAPRAAQWPWTGVCVCEGRLGRLRDPRSARGSPSNPAEETHQPECRAPISPCREPQNHRGRALNTARPRSQLCWRAPPLLPKPWAWGGGK